MPKTRLLGSRWWWVAAGAVIAVAFAGWLLWPSPVVMPREREYRSDLACLLTDNRGLGSAEAAGAWAGLRDASEATLVRSQMVAVDGEQSEPNAMSSLASLVQRQCGLIIATGDAPIAAVLSGSQRFRGPVYAVVAKAAVANPVQTVILGDQSQVRQGVKALVERIFTKTP